MEVSFCVFLYIFLVPVGLAGSLFSQGVVVCFNSSFLRIYRPNRAQLLLVHGQVTIIFVVSVCLFVCLSVCLFVCAEFFSAVFDPISIKLGHMLYVWV